jgi:hypothetical protein
MRLFTPALMVLLASLGACRPTERQTAGDADRAPSPAVLPGAVVELSGLENVALLAPGIISGGEPVGHEGYASLRGLGVRTVVSVDAVPPPADLARSMGIRVVHLPIGYDGVPSDVAVAMAKVLAEAEGPVYVHCHHGKHRGPAALVAGAVCAGIVDHAEADAFMTLTGTSKSYAGLWSDVASTEALDPLELAAAEVDLPERADVGGYAGAMSLVSRANDRVKLVIDNGWAIPDDHPDLAPGSDLGLIYDLLRSLREDPDALAYGAEHKRMLEDSIAAAQAAERAHESGDLDAAAAAFKGLAASCKACHVVYRD